MTNMYLAQLLSKSKLMPNQSGCYLMKNSADEIIYIGKAKNLKNRVTSYFNQTDKSVKTFSLVKHISDFDFIVTQNEVESLILENNLIKKYLPKYNIRLKDDKTYPYISVNKTHPHPSLVYTRKPKRNRDHLTFGPFPHSYELREVVKVLNKSLKLRECSDHDFETRKEPCLLYQLHQCSAPCVKLISQNEYYEQFQLAINFLTSPSNRNPILKQLEISMQTEAQEEHFEKAIVLRDYLDVLERFSENHQKQKVEFHQEDKDLDVWGFYENNGELDLVLLTIRQSMLIGLKSFHFICLDHFNQVEDQVIDLITQFYLGGSEVAPQIVLPIPNTIEHKLEDYFSFQKVKTKIYHNSARFKNLLDKAKTNARENSELRKKMKQSPIQVLTHLKEVLHLNEIPRKIECFDVAIWQGQAPTCSQVVFQDGVSDKRAYRYYHLKTRPEGNNDFAMLEEAIERRIEHKYLPDLLVVDGGSGQLNTILKLLERKKINIPLVAIAKSKVKKNSSFSDVEVIKSSERLIIPGRKDELNLDQYPDLLKLFVAMRDEAHRFSRKLHHHKMRKDFISET